jgi:hypothetical protein
MTTGVSLLERAADVAREFAPLPDRIDGVLGELALIAIAVINRGPADVAERLEVLAKMARG